MLKAPPNPINQSLSPIIEQAIHHKGASRPTNPSPSQKLQPQIKKSLSKCNWVDGPKLQRIRSTSYHPIKWISSNQCMLQLCCGESTKQPGAPCKCHICWRNEMQRAVDRRHSITAIICNTIRTLADSLQVHTAKLKRVQSISRINEAYITRLSQDQHESNWSRIRRYWSTAIYRAFIPRILHRVRSFVFATVIGNLRNNHLNTRWLWMPSCPTLPNHPQHHPLR